MRLRRRYVCGALVLAGMGASYLMLTPRLRLATQAQIEAVLPASLRVVDPPDLAARGRETRLQEIVEGFDKKDPDPALGKLALLLDGSGFEVSDLRKNVDFTWIAYGLVERARVAAQRGDADASLRDVLLGLRFGQALVERQGAPIDVLRAIDIDRSFVEVALETDTRGLFDTKAREAILALLPPLDGTFPQLGKGMKRWFHIGVVPELVDPGRFFKNWWVVSSEDKVQAEIFGSYNALEASRLTGRLYELMIEGTQRTFAKRGTEFQRLYDEARSGLPELLDIAGKKGMDRAFARVRFRVAMNAEHNSIGRAMATRTGIKDVLWDAGPRRAVPRNVLRAILLLRLGRPAAVPDPYGTGNLRVDPMQRIVWSISEDGIDGGGDIRSRGPGFGRDAGYRY